MRGHISSDRFKPASLQTADALITRSLELNPKFAEAFVLRGHLYRLMGRHDEALVALKKAEQLSTRDPWLQNNWADLLLDEGKYDEAAQRYRDVIESKTPNKKAMMAALEGLSTYYTAGANLTRPMKCIGDKLNLNPNRHGLTGTTRFSSFAEETTTSKRLTDHARLSAS